MLFKYIFHAMTTPCEIQIFHDSKTVSDSTASLALKEVKRLEKKYNFYSNESVTAEINLRKSNKVAIDTETKKLLEETLRYSEQVDFVFDITIGTLKGCYKNKQLKKLKKCLKTLSPFVGKENFIIKNSTLIFSNPYTKLDLGGVVKEYSIDRSLAILRENNIAAALINYGGDIFALGVKPDKSKWRIGIKNPKNPSENILFVELENEALTTSAHYERRVQIEDKSYSHIIAPAKQIKNNILQATVISSSTLKSGIFSTSLIMNEHLTGNFKYILIDESLRLSSNCKQTSIFIM